MSIDQTSSRGLPIRVDELRRGDHVIVLGNVVEILDVTAHPDFATALQVMLRRISEGKPASTLLPTAMPLTGLYLPRLVHLRCVLCRIAMPCDVDLAIGTPLRAICGRCANPLTEPTARMPRVRPR